MKEFYPIITIGIILFLSYFVHGYQNEDWDYNFICSQNDKCIREHTDDNSKILYQTQNMCRLTCGRFGPLWPSPTGSTLLGKDIVSFQPDKLRFDFEDIPSITTKEYVKKVSNIFIENVYKECGSNCLQKSDTEITIKISIQSNDTDLSWTTDESYNLNIITNEDALTVKISSPTIFGARHALETLSQLIARNVPDKNTGENGLVIITSVQIRDRPKFPHRGLMVDTSRNFIPVVDIKRTLDAMSWSKLNVFHWHATDAQSFPLEIPKVPQLTRYGAYSPKQIYRYSEIKDIIQYALYRGIRVIIEIDAPSHAGNGWQWGPDYELGDLAVCVNQQPWRDYCIQPPCGQLNPINSNVYKVLKNIYKDLLEVLPHTETIHMGGDEVHLGCWNSTEQIIEYLNKRGFGRQVSDFLQLWSEFQATSLQIWDGENENSPRYKTKLDTPNKVILWSSQLTEFEHIDKYLSKERYIIQTWVESSDNLVNKLLSKGYNLIVSTKNAWYFDHGFRGVTKYYNWRQVFNNKIPRQNGVLGGEACVWSELIDHNTLDSRTWPRGSAVAERLWSDPEMSTILVESRFYRHYERLKTRGVHPESIAPKWCLQNEGKCN